MKNKLKPNQRKWVQKGQLLAQSGRGENPLEIGIASLGIMYERQASIGPYYADFLVKGYKVVIEVDGPDHKHRRIRDAKRDAFMRRQGYTVVRVSSDRAAKNPRGVAVAAFRQALAPEVWARYLECREQDLTFFKSHGTPDPSVLMSWV